MSDLVRETLEKLTAAVEQAADQDWSYDRKPDMTEVFDAATEARAVLDRVEKSDDHALRRVRELEEALEEAGDQLAAAGAAGTAYEPALVTVRAALSKSELDPLREAVEYVSGVALCDSAPFDRMVARLLEHATKTTHPVEAPCSDCGRPGSEHEDGCP